MKKSHKTMLTVKTRFLSTWQEIHHHEEEMICPLCMIPLKDRDEAYILVNNSTMFPNRIIHRHCWTEDSDKILTKQWEEAKKHQHWFI